MVPPTTAREEKEDSKGSSGPDTANDEFLAGRKDAEDMPKGASDGGSAHAPYWPAVSQFLISSWPPLFIRNIDSQARMVDRSR